MKKDCSVMVSELDLLKTDYFVRNASRLSEQWNKVFNLGLVRCLDESQTIREKMKEILLHEKWGMILRDYLRISISSRVKAMSMAEALRKIGATPKQHKVLYALILEIEEDERFMEKDEARRKGIDLTA